MSGKEGDIRRGIPSSICGVPGAAGLALPKPSVQIPRPVLVQIAAFKKPRDSRIVIYIYVPDSVVFLNESQSL